MTDRNKPVDDDKNEADKAVGGSEGGADASGPGNILGGVQPSNETDGKTERRRD